MKRLSIPTAFLAVSLLVQAQETTQKWEVEIPEPVTDGTASEPRHATDPVDFTVLSSRTTQMEVIRGSEMPDLPPVKGTINVTVQAVKDPGLPDPPLPNLPPGDPAVTARIEELHEKYEGVEILFLSATIYDKRRTLLSIYPDGRSDEKITVWSNLDFNHFSGLSAYRVEEADGSFRDIALLMGIDNVSATGTPRLEGQGDDLGGSQIPELPDPANGGPAFTLVEGSADSTAMDALEQLHDLFRKEGPRMKAESLVREAALAERKVQLLANPPKPQDVKIRFWQRGDGSNSSSPTLQSR